MSSKRQIFLLLMGGITAAVIFVVRSFPERNSSQVTTTQGKQVLPKQDSHGSASQMVPAGLAKPLSPSPKVVPHSEDDSNAKLQAQDEPESIIAKARFHDAASLRSSVMSLKRLSRDEVVNAIMHDFAKSTGSLIHREKLIWFARRLGGPELIPLWRAVLDRTPPRTWDESLSYGPHASESASIAMTERLIAIGALSEIRSDQSLEILEEIAHGRSSVPALNTTLRFEAAWELQSADRRTFLRLARTLSQDDPLRGRLAAWARAEKE